MPSGEATAGTDNLDSLCAATYDFVSLGSTHIDLLHSPQAGRRRVEHRSRGRVNFAAMALATNKVRWGLLSTAWINVAMVGPMQRSSRSELAAVASRSLEKAEAYAAANHISKAYGSYEELVDDPEIDAIYNPLPNTLHAEWTIRSAQAGKHVMCEKPLVTSLEDLRAVEAAAIEHRVTIFEAVSFLHHPQIQTIKQMIAEGQLGEVELVVCWHAFCLPAEDRDNIRLQPQLAGGALWDVGVYPNDFAIALADGKPPTEVWAQQTVGPTGVDLTLIGQLRFADGMVAQISCGMRSPDRRGAQIIGTQGMLIVPDHLSGAEWPGNPPEQGRLTFIDTGRNQRVIRIPAVDAYEAEVKAMEACVLDGADPVVSLDLSRSFLKSVLALYQSARTGKVITVN